MANMDEINIFWETEAELLQEEQSGRMAMVSNDATVWQRWEVQRKVGVKFEIVDRGSHW